MIRAIVAFELKRRLLMLSTWVYAAVLFAAGLFLMLAAGGVFKSLSVSSGSEKVMANSPTSLFGTTSAVALFGLLMVAAVYGQAASQDFTTGSWMIVFSKNVKKTPYLLGRFLGAFLFSSVLLLAIAAGQGVGAVVVGLLDATQLTTHQTAAYLWPYLVQVWPMLFFAGTVFFGLAALSRRMAPVYVGMVVLVLGYLVLSTLSADVSNKDLVALLDPFGMVTFEVATRYWTPVERNRDLLPLAGLFLINRVLWTSVGVAVLGATVARFRTTVDEHAGKSVPDTKEAPPAAGPLPSPTPEAQRSHLASALTGGWLHFRDVLRSPIYWSFVVAGLTMVLLGVLIAKSLFGTPTWPVTWQVLELAAGMFGLFSLITLTFYAGELAWKERDAGLADIVDAAPVPGWVAFVSKLLALLLVALSLELVVGVASITAQLAVGFTDFNWRVYGTELFVFGFLADIQLCVLALTAQAVINHKVLGHFVMVAYYILNIALRALGVEDRLVRYGSAPHPQYSDMNGYGHFLDGAFLYRGYWLFFAGLLALVAYAFLARGRETAFKTRLAAARRRFTLGPRLAMAGFALGFIALGGFLFQQTHLATPFVTDKDIEKARARYEKVYKPWEVKPQPRITAADVHFDLYPEAPRLRVTGTYTLQNKTQLPVTEVLLGLAAQTTVHSLTVAGAASPSARDDDADVRIYTLPTPLPPGETATLAFDLEFAPRRVSHGSPGTSVVENGTFFNNFNLPMLGYQADSELVEDHDRKSYGLEPRARMADRDDEAARQNNYIRKDSDFIAFRAVASTSLDQIAVAPGTLKREWTEGGRRHFEYEMDQPILNFFSVLSARYELKEDQWNGVKLQLFFHSTHRYNLDSMMQAMKDTLAYCTEAFGPYQHQQARILEFPRYQQFAQAFPNTIPYSEGVGFIARVRPDEPDDVDYPYYVTAHEIAHQWWAHQVVGGNVQGATMTSETMAQYAALMVMKRRFGPAKMKRFLKYELDKYLMGRAMERKKEVPLSRVENQPYIHYQKGSLVMYALQDFIGEDAVNRALKKYVEAVRFKGPPYTNSTELLSYLKAETPEAFLPRLEDLFETITLYDNRAKSASMKQNAAGGWDVTVEVVAKKYRADESGEQTELPFDDLMDVGALDDRGEAIFLTKQRITSGESTVTFTVPTRPAQVGVDPMNVLIDRGSDDNVVAPTEG